MWGRRRQGLERKDQIEAMKRRWVGTENGKCRKIGNATVMEEEHGYGSNEIEVNFGFGDLD